MQNQHLWNNILAFELDEKNTEFPFSKRLARENDWGDAFTQKVIQEYKKFIYLCCVSKNQLTPSGAVDQAWHLHLTYTKSYWKEFCGQVLKKEIHHHPTKGGSKETHKFSVCYNQTLELYRKELKTEPPSSIWLNNNERFKKPKNKRVDTNKFWLIKKPSKELIAYSCILLVAIGAPLLFVQSKNSYSIFIILLIFMVLIVFFFKKRNRKKSSTSDDSNYASLMDTGLHDHVHNKESNDTDSSSGHSSAGDSSSDCSGGCGGGCGD